MRAWRVSALLGALAWAGCTADVAVPSGFDSAIARGEAALDLPNPPDLSGYDVSDTWLDLRPVSASPPGVAWSTALVSDGTEAPVVKGLVGIRDRVVLVGSTPGELSIDGRPVLAGAGEGPSFLVALDPDGKVAWARRTKVRYARVRASKGNELLAAGTSERGELVVQRWGADGNLIREQRWSCDAEIAALAPGPDNGFVLAANLGKPCRPAGEYLDDGALVVGMGRNSLPFTAFWKGMRVIDLDTQSRGDLIVARTGRGGDELVRVGPDGRTVWSEPLSPQRAARVTVDPLGRIFLATDAELSARSSKGTRHWRSGTSGVSALSSGWGWLARTESIGPNAIVSVVRAIDGEVRVRWDEALASAQVAAAPNNDALFALSSRRELAWEDGGIVARGSPGNARVTVLRLGEPAGP